MNFCYKTLTLQLIFGYNGVIIKTIIKHVRGIVKRSDFMNEILGKRIKDLRDTKGFTQEEVADHIQCSRQKYSRIEKGLVDISYAMLTKISDVLEVEVQDITCVLEKKKKATPMFRVIDSEDKGQDVFQEITDMIDTFYAHKKIFDSMRRA